MTPTKIYQSTGPGGRQIPGRMIECRDCGFEHYWCDACQRSICGHLDDPSAPAEAPPPTGPSLLERLEALAAWVLAGISPEADLLELTETPKGQYTLRIEIPREVSKPLVIAKCLVEQAAIQPASVRTLRNILHAYVLSMNQTRAVSDVRETLAERRYLLRSKPGR